MDSLRLSPSRALLALALGGIAVASSLLWTGRLEPFGFALAFLLAWAAVVDLDRLILPDAITLSLIGLGLLEAVASGGSDLVDRSAAALIGYLALTILATAYRRVRARDGLGQGDAKLFAAGGAWLGWAALPAVMLVASISALVFVGWLGLSRRLVPYRPGAFGPFLALGIWLAWLAR